MALINGKEAKRNVHLKTFNFWKESRFLNDTNQIAKLLGISRRSAVNAVNIGYANFEDIHKITKFYESKIEKANQIQSDYQDIIKRLSDEKVPKRKIAKALKVNIDSVFILAKDN